MIGVDTSDRDLLTAPTRNDIMGITTMELVYKTELGQLFKGDCLEVLQSLRSGSVHNFFADPPFNLNKKYGREGSGDLPEEKYLEWSKAWLKESARVLAPGEAPSSYTTFRSGSSSMAHF